jgi:uncharacterized membrane protein YccC
MESEPQSIHPGPWGEFPDSLWRAYFGRESDYYMNQLAKLRAGQRLDFSLVAFLFGLAWMIYRKMYAVAFAALMIILLESTLEEVVSQLLRVPETVSGALGTLISIVLGILVGSYANRVYLWDARRAIRQVLQEMPHASSEELTDRIRRSGGTSVLALIAALMAGGALLLALVYAADLLQPAESID